MIYITQLREKDYDSIKDVDYAILETSGKLSIFPKTGFLENNKTNAFLCP